MKLLIHLSFIRYALLVLFYCSCVQSFIEHPFVVVIPSRNNVSICERNLSSVFQQTYQNYRIIYIDDASDDGMYEAVQAYIAACDQWHRVTLLRNDVRRGQMYNHYIAGHMCANHEIIINLDGDDWLEPDALETINKAYQDDNVWMTYGQYREEPNKKHGHCRPMPAVIKKQNAYRYYDWVTSHPRTFYAGLFKQVPLGYFLHEGNFFPSAVDLAMMFAMLELSSGKIQFIDKVIYNYNCANPNNIFKTGVLQQLKMGYTSRGREPLAPLSFDPRCDVTKNVSQARASIIIVSNNNPDALAQALTYYNASGTLCDDIHVVYFASTSDIRGAYLDFFAEQPTVHMHYVACTRMLQHVLLDICDTISSSYILFMTDDTYVIRDLDLNRCISLLEKTHACGFYFNLGKEVTRSTPLLLSEEMPSLVQIEDDVYAWKFNQADGLWGVPYTCDGALYRVSDMRTILNRSACVTIDMLRKALSLMSAPRREDVGLCYATAALTCQIY